jgi:hypothetical protein
MSQNPPNDMMAAFLQHLRDSEQRREDAERKREERHDQFQAQLIALLQRQQPPTPAAPPPRAVATPISAFPATSPALDLYAMHTRDMKDDLFRTGGLATQRTLDFGGVPVGSASAAIDSSPSRPSQTSLPEAATAVTASDAARSKALRGLKLPTREKFLGKTLEERKGARLWLQGTLNWMRLHVSDQDEETQVAVFANFLDGEALRWFTAYQSRIQAMGKTVTLAEVMRGFIEKMEGAQALVLLQQEFSSLTMGKGRCRDLYATESEFDYYVLILYPGATENVQADAMLGLQYSNVIRRGDNDLWEEAIRQAPVTLQQWKLAVQTAYTIRLTKQQGRLGTPARVNNLGGRSSENGKQSETEKESEGEEEQSAALQYANTSGPGRQGKRSGVGHPERRGVELTVEEESKLKAARRCLDCYTVGHRWRNCRRAKDKLPQRRPNVEELAGKV